MMTSKYLVKVLLTLELKAESKTKAKQEAVDYVKTTRDLGYHIFKSAIIVRVTEVGTEGSKEELNEVIVWSN